MSSVNVYRETSTSDYLEAMRKELAKSKAKNVSSTALLEYIFDFYNIILITNSANVNGNKRTFANQINVSNSMSRTNQDTGTFLIDTAMIDFSDVS
jgi:hypothetical protein